MQILRGLLRSSRLFVSRRRPAGLAVCALLLLLSGRSAVAQNGSAPGQDHLTAGVPWVGSPGIQRTTGELMDAQAVAGVNLKPARRMTRMDLEGPDRRYLPQDVHATAVANTAATGPGQGASARRRTTAQSISTAFTGATLADSGLFPPDAMGAVGPTQFVVFVNGRLRTVDKTTGVADTVIDIDPDIFFNAVMSPVPDGGLNYTSHPQVRYDRLTKRWILAIIDIPSSSTGTLGDLPNRLLLAVSDAPSNGVISGATAWTLYVVQQDTVGGIPSNGQFLDYESLGVDANALYVGGNMFDAASGVFIETSAFVIRKSSILSGGPIVTTAFRGLAGAGDGPWSPRGVDNYDPAATEGYVIGVSFDFSGRLIMRRISTPGDTPAITGNIEITVSSTSFPISVDHLGNTLGTAGELDARDDGLFAAHIRNGRLWTAHAIAVTSAGVATDSDPQERDAVRWYELVVPSGTGTPTVNQSGTIFDSAPTVAAARQYWFPSVTVSGQGHAAVGFSTAGTPFHIDAATTGRLAGDALGTMGSVSLFSASASAYNPPDDTSTPRRWGEYSFTSLDPNDDMTMWTIQEFNDSEDSYGLRVARLLAPAPATPASASSVPAGSPSVIVSMTGTSVSGSGFFDPGPGFTNRLTASVTGVTVNSVTFTDATHVVLDISTVGATAGAANVTITNPDGQSATGNSLITVTATPPAVVTGAATGISATAATLTGTANPNGTATTGNFEWGLTASYGNTTPVQTLGSGNAALPIGGGTISGLTCGTMYHFRAVATNTSATTNGLDASFTTAACVPPCTFSLSAPSASVPGTAMNGSVTLTASAPSCAWTAVSNNGFIAVTSPGAGTDTTTVTWTVTGNRITSQRTGTITIADLTFTITQAGGLIGHRIPNDFNRDGISDLGVFRPSPGRFLIAAQPNSDWGAAGDMPVAGDFNGDGYPDIAVFRPANGTWYINGGATIVWGAASDIPVPGDYDGDGTTDIAVFRPSTGMFYIRNGASVAWGLAGDLPVIGDYDGDGLDDIAVYRPGTGTWYVRNVVTVAFGFAADIPVPADYNGDDITDIAVFRPATGTWIIRGQYTQVWGASGDIPVPLDRDGDGLAELGVFRRATGTWYFKNHATDASETVSLGVSADIPLNRAMPPVQTRFGDYDGDRKADLTVFRPSTGDWVSLRSLSGMTDYTLRSWGLNGDVPAGRDYDGDGKIDFAVYRPSLGRWFVLQSSTNDTSYAAQDWGLSTDTPVPADYDGDGKADFAVFRPSLGRWVILLSSSNNASYVQYDWGLDGDIPVPADYDGDARADLAVFRPSIGRWLIRNTLTGAVTSQDWGLNGDVPVASDFDGDGKADIAVFRPSTGRWYIKSSIDGSYQVADWGLTGDDVVPADYDGDGKADIAVFRPSTGMWYVRGLFNRSWGLSSDIPALKNP